MTEFNNLTSKQKGNLSSALKAISNEMELNISLEQSINLGNTLEKPYLVKAFNNIINSEFKGFTGDFDPLEKSILTFIDTICYNTVGGNYEDKIEEFDGESDELNDAIQIKLRKFDNPHSKILENSSRNLAETIIQRRSLERLNNNQWIGESEKGNKIILDCNENFSRYIFKHQSSKLKFIFNEDKIKAENGVIKIEPLKAEIVKEKNKGLSI